jgi:hypothetical protein
MTRVARQDLGRDERGRTRSRVAGRATTRYCSISIRIPKVQRRGWHLVGAQYAVGDGEGLHGLTSAHIHAVDPTIRNADRVAK